MIPLFRLLFIRARSVVVVIILATTLCRSAWGQAIQDGGVWLAAFSQGEIQRSFLSRHDGLWWFDAHTRYVGDAFEFLQSIVRPGIGWQLSDDQSVWVGYAWIGERIPGLDFHENRFWQQWIFNREFGDVSAVFRSRLEQRFVSVGAQAGWRFRQMIRFQKPVAKNPRLLWVAWDEIFYHLRDTDWGARTGYNQNRIFVGLGRTASSNSRRRTEIGYLYQQIEIPEDGADLSNHILSINVFFGR